MVWGRTSDGDDHRHRSDALSGVLGQTGRRAAAAGRGGSRGGAPIWVAHGEGFGLMPRSERNAAWRTRDGQPRRTTPVGEDRPPDFGRPARWAPRKGPDSPPYRQALAGGHDRAFSQGPFAPAYEGPRGLPHVTDDQADGDPDGYAVFGRFPKGFLRYILRLRLLGDVRRDEVLHVCSGTLTEAWTVDVRAEARPRVQADGKHLPFRDASFKAVLMDPPYSDAYARNLYGVENPRPSWLLREAARVVQPGGRVGLLHVAVPFAPPGCDLVRVVPVSTGVGFRIRALTIYEREQQSLPL